MEFVVRTLYARPGITEPHASALQISLEMVSPGVTLSVPGMTIAARIRCCIQGFPEQSHCNIFVQNINLSIFLKACVKFKCRDPCFEPDPNVCGQGANCEASLFFYFFDLFETLRYLDFWDFFLILGPKPQTNLFLPTRIHRWSVPIMPCIHKSWSLPGDTFNF